MHPLFHPLFVEFCAYFNGNEDYFECHESLEEYWKEIAPGERKHPLVGYVQLATGLYHWRRGNATGAARILQKAERNFVDNAGSEFFEFVNYDELLHNCRIAAISAQSEPFEPFTLTITNDELVSKVCFAISNLPTLEASFLLHKHMLRDRSHILAEREAKLNRKL